MEETINNVLELQAALEEMKSLVLFKTVIDANNAQIDSFQTSHEHNASDLNQYAVAHRDTLLMVLIAKIVKPVSLFQQQTINNVLELKVVHVIPSMATLKTATDVLLVFFHRFQMLIELHVIDQDQPVHALRDILKMDSHVLTAKLDILLITEEITTN